MFAADIGDRRVPGDVDDAGEQGLDLGFVAGEQDVVEGDRRLIDEVVLERLPDRHRLGVIGDGAQADRRGCLCHWGEPQKSGMPSRALPMNSFNTSLVGAMIAPAWASR